ncbi:phosphate-starvation-inducible PsiE family protein [Nocardioides kribbensis]|uniref:phosphate-starvation-inducible PsiE family protein n=1 Tax=Nocardioides kribbensis TaxID=305517 RepID=UPI0018797630|nr:phosphate-starvation-inducible PsiE family protein [Nocardioides kribbensis]
MSTRSKDAPSSEERRAEVIDRAIGWLEDTLYVVIAVVLAICATALVVDLARGVPDLFVTGGQAPVLEVLDAVLLVFIVVELLFAVRATVARRELVAEPFLIVGIIASIKEIVVVSVKAAEATGKGDVFRDDVTLIGVLGVLTLLLAAAAYLLRRKEREPDEGREDDDAVADSTASPDSEQHAS